MGSIPITRSNPHRVIGPHHHCPVPGTARDPKTAMQRLYLARDRIEAQFLRDFLDHHLIATQVLGDYLAGAAGQLPVDIFPTVWVLDDGDLERAQELLGRFLSQSKPDPNGAPWTCEACGESVEGDFALCWNCGHPRP